MKPAWPRGVKHPRVLAQLDASHGEIIARLIAALIAWIATESVPGRALVAIDDQRRLLIEPADSTQAEWIQIRCSHWIVGTYTPLSEPAQIEGDLCARLAELRTAA